MRNYVSVNCDLYINKSDLIKLDNGDAVTGFKQIYNQNEYELISRYAFLPALVINENSFNVCAINK